MSVPDAVSQSDIKLPEELHWLSYVAGSEWPKGSENGMFALADAWSDASGELSGVVTSIEDAVKDILAAYPSAGEMNSSMVQTLKHLTEESDTASLQAIAKSMHQLAGSCDKVGCAIQENKIMIVVGLVQLIYEIALAWLSPVTAPAQEVVLIAWYQVVFQWLKKLMMQMIIAALNAMGQQMILNILIQLGQMAAHHRDGFDGKALWQAAVGGALGGAFGAAFGKLGGDLFKFMGGKITRTEFDKRWQQLLTGMVQGGAGGVGGMVGGGVANMALNGGPFELDPRMLGAGAAGAFSGGARGWRASGAKPHVDLPETGNLGTKLPAGGPPVKPGEVPPGSGASAAPVHEPAGAGGPKANGDNANGKTGSSGGADQGAGATQKSSAPSVHGNETAENSSGGRSGQNEAAGRSGSHDSSAQSHTDNTSSAHTDSTSPRANDGSSTADNQHRPVNDQTSSGVAGQPHSNGAAAAHQPAATEPAKPGAAAAAGAQPQNARATNDAKGAAPATSPRTTDSSTSSSRPQVGADQRAQPRMSDTSSSSVPDVQTQRSASTVTKPDTQQTQIHSTPEQTASGSRAKPEGSVPLGGDKSPSSGDHATQIGDKSSNVGDKTPNTGDKSAGSGDKSTNTGDKPNAGDKASASGDKSTNPTKEPAKSSNSPSHSTDPKSTAPPQRSGAAKDGDRAGSTDPVNARAHTADGYTGRARWRRVEADLLGPVWPGGRAFLREVIGFQQTLDLLRGSKSPHDDREPFRQVQGTDLPMREGFGQKKPGDTPPGHEGAAVHGYDKPLSRGVYRLNENERAAHLFKIEDGHWSRVEEAPAKKSDDAASSSSKTDESPPKNGKTQPAPGRNMVGEDGGTPHTAVPRTGPLLKRWAEGTAPVMRTVVGDHEGRWYVSDLPHEAFHNAGVYVAFKAEFVNGKLASVFDWAGAYHPSPARIKAALGENYDGIAHFDQHGRKYTPSEQEGWLPAAERTPAGHDDVAPKPDHDDAPHKPEHSDLPDPPPHRAPTDPPNFERDAKDLLDAYKPDEWAAVTRDDLKAALSGSIHHDAQDPAQVAEYHRAVTAAVEVVRRETGKTLRWTQVMAVMAMRHGPINMDAGEGKTLAFLADAMLKASAGEPVQVFTTRDTLANDAFRLYNDVLRPYGFDVGRMNPEGDPTGADADAPQRPTINIGTLNDAGFGRLRDKVVPGRIAVLDEIDEALVHADTTWILSEGAAAPAAHDVAERVAHARDFLDQRLTSGELTPAHFGRTADQVGGPAKLTEDGRSAVKELLAREQPADRTLTEAQRQQRLDDAVRRIESAASARWEFVENDHYIVDKANNKVFIIDQTTHKVMFDPKTSTESRWNGGLAQAVEAKHGLTIRNDSGGARTLTAKEMFSGTNYDSLTGASGTAEGVSHELVAKYGMTDVVKIPRFEESRLDVLDASTARDQSAKHQMIADDIAAEHSPTARPQLVIANRNSEVAQLSALLSKANVDHIAVDAKWFLDHGEHAEARLQQIFDQAGQLGKVLIINRQGGRGVDIPVSHAVSEAGGLHVSVTSKSNLRDIDIQAENRAARAGQEGSVRYYLAADDALFAHAPEHALTIIRYTDAVAEHATLDAKYRATQETQKLAEAAHQAAPTPANRAVLDAARDDHDAALAARDAGLRVRQAAETELADLAPVLQARNSRPEQANSVAALADSRTDGTQAAPIAAHQQDVDGKPKISELETTAAEADTSVHNHLGGAAATPDTAALAEVKLADPQSRELGKQIATIAETIKQTDRADLELRAKLRQDQQELQGQLTARFAELSPDEQQIAVARAEQLGSIDRHEQELADREGISLDELRARMTSELETAFTGKDVAIRVSEDSLADVLRDGRFKTAFDYGETGEGRNSRGLLEHRWFGHDQHRHPVEKRAVYGYVRMSEERPARRHTDDYLSNYGEVQVVLKAAVRARTTACVGDSIADQMRTYPSPLEHPLPESFGVYAQPKRAVLPSAQVGLGRDLTHPDFEKWRYVEAQVHGGVEVADIDHVVFPMEPGSEVQDLLHRNGIPWKVFGSADAGPVVPAEFADFFASRAGAVAPAGVLGDVVTHTATESDPAVSNPLIGWKSHLNSLRLLGDDEAQRGKNFLNVPIRFKPEDVVSQSLIGPDGRTIGVSFKHVQFEIEHAANWAGAQLWHDQVVRTQPGQGGAAVFNGPTRKGQELADAPWASEYANRGKGPFFVNAHAGSNTFEIRLRTGTTLEVNGRTFAALLEASAGFRDTFGTGTATDVPSSVVLLSCKAAKGSAAPDFAAALHETFPGTDVHASSGVVTTSTKWSRDAPDTRARLVSGDNNAGWETLRSDGSRTTHANTRYEGATVPVHSTVRSASAVSHDAAVEFASRAEMVNPPGVVVDAAVTNTGTRDDAEPIVDTTVSNPLGFKTHLRSLLLSGDDVLTGENFLHKSVKFKPSDVVSRVLAGADGQPIGVSFKHVAHEVDASTRWAQAQNWQDKVVRTQPGQKGQAAFDGATRIGHEVVPAPWAAEYGAGGKGPVYIDAHAGKNTFEIRLKTGTTLDVDGATFGRLIKESPAFHDALGTDVVRSVVLMCCNAAKGSAAPDFATAMRDMLPAATVHASSGTVSMSSMNFKNAPNNRYRLLAAEDNAGWEAFDGNGGRTMDESTRYDPATATTTAAARTPSGIDRTPTVTNTARSAAAPATDPLSASAAGPQAHPTQPASATSVSGETGKSKRPLSFDTSDVLSRPLLDKHDKVIGVSFVTKDAGQREAVKWARAASGQDKVVLTDAGQTVEDVAKHRMDFGTDVVDAPWKADYDNGAPGPIFIDAHASPERFSVDIRQANGTSKTVQVDGENYAKIVKASAPFQQAMQESVQSARSLVLISCKAGKKHAAADFARAMRDLLPNADVHAGVGTVQVSAKKAGKTFATLGVNRNKGWVTIRSDDSAEIQQSTIKADTGRTGSGTNRTARTDVPTGATRAHASEPDDEYTGSADAQAGDAQLRQWFARNVFDDAFDRAVRGRPVRDGTSAEELSDFEGASDDVRHPEPAAGLFVDEPGVRLSEDALSDLFQQPSATGVDAETVVPAAHPDVGAPDTATLLALPRHAAPAVMGAVPQDRTVVIDRLGNPHVLGVDEGWRVLGTRFTQPDTGHEYVGLVPLDQKSDIDPIWIRDGLLDQAFHFQKRLFPWGTDCYLTLPGLGFDGVAGRAQWLPGGSSITVKPAQNADGTADLTRTMFRDPQATDPANAWRTLPRQVLGVALPGLRTFDGPLWHAERGPLESDVRQGRLGDCFFVANMIALARSSRQPIPEMMVDLGDSVAVRFFDQAGAPVWKRVTKDLYVDGDGTARNAAHLGVLWPAILEKAYAVFAGDHGYAGLDGGDPVDAARNLQPANLSGGLRSQPSRAVMDHYFLHPMRMDTDAYTRFASGDEEFARTIAALHSTWETELRAHIARERNPVGNNADSDLVIRLIETQGDARQAVQEFHRQIRPDNPASATGFRRFLDRHLSADQRTRWAAHIDTLVDHTGREAAWRDRLLDPATMRPVADRVQFALDRGDLVMLSTRPWGVDDTALVPGLVGGHAYTVLGVERDAHGNPVALTLRNPWGSHTETPAPLPGIRHDDGGVVHVNLEHLNKFGKLTVSGSAARALFGLDELPLPFDSLVRTAAGEEETSSSAQVRTDPEDLPVAHVTHPLELKRRFATIRLRLDKNLLLGETENTNVYTFRAKKLIQEPILDHQGRTIGITFLHEQAQLRLLHGWGNAQNGHDRVVRMRSDEEDLTAVMSDPAKLTPDRLTAAPWAGEYRGGRSGPLYISVHAAENGFEVQLRSGTAVAVDGQTFASIIKASPTFRDALAADPAKPVVMVACEIAAGPAGRDFAQAIHESFPQSRIYASEGSVQTYVDSSLGIGLLGAVRDRGWVSYFGDAVTNYPRTRFPITGTDPAVPEVVSASVIHSGSDDDAYVSDSASETSLDGDLTTIDMTHPIEWRARLHTLRRMLVEDPLLGVTPGSFVVKFEAKDVQSHPLLNHLGETIGVSFHHKNDLRGAQVWAQTEIGHDKVIRMGADETDMLAIGSRIRQNALSGANTHPEVVPAPWQREYRDGRNGPVYISAHAGPDHFEIRLKSKVSIIVDGPTFATIVESAQPFRDALTSGTLTPGTAKSFVLVACEAAKGEAGAGFADAIRVNFPDNRIYASQGVVHTSVVGMSTPSIQVPDLSMIGAHNNAGWISYWQGKGYQHANTRYPAQNPPGGLVIPQANLPATGTIHSSPSYSAGTLFGVRMRRPRERSTDE